MRKMYLSVLVITEIIWLLSMAQSLLAERPGDDDFIDPNDIFNYDSVNMRMKNANKNVPVVQRADETEPEPEEPSKPATTESTASCNISDEEYAKLKQSHTTTDVLLRQYVMTIIHTLESKVGPSAGHPVELDMRLQLTFIDLERLQQFGNGDVPDFHDAHERLFRMIQYASDVVPPRSQLYWLEEKIGLSSPVLLQTVALVIAIVVLVWMLPSLIISRRFLFRSIFVTFVVSVVFTWFEMYQKEVADQKRILSEAIEAHCPRMDDMPWYNRLFSYITDTFTFKDERCRKFYHAMLINPWVKVSPIEAVSVAFVKTFVTPLGIIAHGIKTFLVELLSGLPVQYQVYIMLGLALFVFLTPFLIFGYQVRIAHLLTFGPAPRIAPVQPPVDERHRVEGPVHQPAPVAHAARPQLVAPYPGPQAALVQGEDDHPRENAPVQAEDDDQRRNSPIAQEEGGRPRFFRGPSQRGDACRPKDPTFQIGGSEGCKHKSPTAHGEGARPKINVSAAHAQNTSPKTNNLQAQKTESSTDHMSAGDPGANIKLALAQLDTNINSQKYMQGTCGDDAQTGSRVLSCSSDEGATASSAIPAGGGNTADNLEMSRDEKLGDVVTETEEGLEEWDDVGRGDWKTSSTEEVQVDQKASDKDEELIKFMCLLFIITNSDAFLGY